MEALARINSAIHAVVWGPPMIALLLAVGLFLALRTRFVQFTRFGQMLRETITKSFRRGPRGEGDITPFQAVTVAMGGTVGVGNIAGVATAISLGGPGAIFWMLVSGLIGMGTKFVEVTLGVHYRKREPGQPMIGGPMRYIEGGMGRRWKWLAMVFGIFGAAAAFGIGNMVQANAVAEGMSHFHVPRYITGGVLLIAVGLVTIGGLKRIATVANVFVPLMCGLYIIAATVIILSNIAKLPDVVALVVRHAFTPAAATGGFAGSSVLMAIRYGFARGVFSNEAGMGSAPIAHATAMTDHPARQGLWGIFEVFVDTLVICALTGFSILLSGVWSDGSTGATLTMHAFATTYGHHLGFALVAISMVLTAYDTLLAWGFYGETCAAYVFGHGLKVRQVYRLLWLPATLLGALGTLEVIWSIADTLNGLMALPNLIALLVLGSVAARLARGFFAGRPYDPALGARR